MKRKLKLVVYYVASALWFLTFGILVFVQGMINPGKLKDEMRQREQEYMSPQDRARANRRALREEDAER